MRSLLVANLFAFLLINSTYACLNGDSKFLKDGTFLYFDKEGMVPYGHDFISNNFDIGIVNLDKLYKKTKDLDYLSDKALIYILKKRYNEAIRIYQLIERISPNRYATASNMGTAYELMGNNELALFWIKKSFKINPESHMNSEWLHIKILEAKIKGKSLYNSNFLINTDFGSNEMPQTKLSVLALHKLYKALYYQLNERVSFVKPKEEIVALLLFELGNIALHSKKYNEAIEDYNQALKYGFNKPIIYARMKYAKSLVLVNNKKRK
jgi:tetratricopeptide (TPR) repeat protein